MPKTNIPNYRLHKATGQAFVELGGRRFYLGKHGSKASREEYERRVAEYLTNGRQLPPTGTKTGISCKELAIHFLEWAEEYFMSQPKSFAHIKTAMGFLVKHYGRESVDSFVPLSLVFMQKKLVEHGYARPMVNRYVGIIKRAFKHGTKFGWVSAPTSYALQVVDNLKKGRTQAHEYRDIKPVDPDIFETTLSQLPKRIGIKKLWSGITKVKFAEDVVAGAKLTHRFTIPDREKYRTKRQTGHFMLLRRTWTEQTVSSGRTPSSVISLLSKKNVCFLSPHSPHLPQMGLFSPSLGDRRNNLPKICQV